MDKTPWREPYTGPLPTIGTGPTDSAGTQPAATTDREMRELERRMYATALDDPERQKVVDRYNAVCDELGVPSGDNC